MPIFDNELIDNTVNRELQLPEAPLESVPYKEISVPTLHTNAPDYSKKGMSLEDLDKIQVEEPTGFAGTFSSIPKSELLANKRYPMYQRGVDLENIYGLQQSWYNKLGHSLVKTGVRAIGTFAQGMADIPNVIDAIRKGDISELAGDPDGYEGTIDNWMNNIENVLPNYMSREEKAHPYLAMIPFAPGSANFWGEMVLKNLGFTAGAIASAAVQDLAIGAITGGIGEVPLLANQIGKASLYLNKIAGGTNKVEEVLTLAKSLGKSEQQLLKIQQLGNLAQATKVLNGARYGIITWGAAQTEAGVEAREGYARVKEELIQQYKDNNYGEEPVGSALEEIENYATDAMNTRFGINMALLTVSNAVQFDNLFKSFVKAEKGISGGILTQPIEGAGKIGLKKESLDVFEKKATTSLSGRIWESVKPKLANVLAEGVYEEGGQYAAERGTYDYYTRKYKNLSNPNNKKNWDDLKEIVNSTAFGMAEQFGSEEGIQNMLVGGITAMLTGTAESLYDRKKGNGKDARLQSSINILNRFGMTGILSDKFDNTLNSVAIAKEMDEAAKSGNVFKYKNLKHDMFFNFVQSRIPSGMHDVTIEQLGMLKDLSKEEFEKTFGMDFNSSNQKTVSGYVDSLIEKANDIKKTSEAVDATFKNPFISVVDPKTEEEKKSADNYKTFEEWKLNLKYYATIKEDVNQRLDSIEKRVMEINPLVNNEVLAKLTDRTSLFELSKQYEERANQLNNTITDYTTPADKKSIREQIKALRTASERITIALNKSELDLKTFHSLLNFELNNQDVKKDDVVGLENASELYTYGGDINKNLQHKKDANDTFDKLATEEGFNKFFKQAEDIAKNEISIEDLGKGLEEPTFVNKDKQKEKLEVGREYSIDATKKASVKKIADDRYQVTGPDGTVSFYKTRKEAVEESKDLTNENTNLSKVKVIALNEDGTVKVEDVNGDILNIDPKRLKGYIKIQTEEEKLQKDKEVIDAQQTQLENTSGDVITTPTEDVEYIGSEDKRKDVDRLFIAGTSPSEDNGGEEVNNKPHIKRARTFLNNFKFFKDKDKIKLILVTPNNAKALGLEGIVQLNYDKPITDVLTEEETNTELGFMAQVFIIQTPKGDFFVNEKGKPLSKVGEPNSTILDNVVFQTMTSASLYTTGGFEKVRKGQEQEAERALEAYKIFRQDVFAQEGYTPYSFAISRGIARQNKVNGKYEDNHISSILGPEGEKIISQENGLIKVVTTGKLEHDGELLSFPKGTTLIQYGDLLDFANNKKVTNKQATNIFGVIEALAKDVIEQSNSGKTVKLNYAYSKFLQNVLFWRSKADTTSSSQIGIDTTTMEFKIGNKSFPLSQISQSKKEIINALQDAFIIVNNKTLAEGTSKSFTEFVVDKDGQLKPVVWKNYQTYLLSGKNPDGSSRSAEETPLITHTAIPTETQEAYKQKYAYITDRDVLPYDRVVVKETPTPVTKTKEENVIGEYVMNGETVNTFSVNTGPILFTGTVSPEGIISVDVKDNETIEKLSTDAKLVSAVEQNLNSLPKELVTINLNTSTNEEKAKFFVKIRIEAELGKQLEAKETIPVAEEKPVQPMASPEVVAQQELEVKKADIERRRKEELSKELVGQKVLVGNLINRVPTEGIIKEVKLVTKQGFIPELGFYASNIGNDVFSNITKTTELYSKIQQINAKYDAELAALEGTKPAEEKTNEFIPVTDDNIKQGDVLYGLYKFTTDIANTYTVKSLSFHKNGELKGVLLVDKDTNKEEWWNSSDKINWKSLFKKPSDPNNKPFNSGFKFGQTGPSEYRLIGEDKLDRMSNEELEIFKQWHEENVPNIPFEVLENVIKRGDIEAWGVFENGVAKFVRGGLRGTEYHEIFEAIYADFLSEEEKNNLLTEFRNKKGEFVDRATGKKILYSEATDKEAKERIADDFADFRTGKLPARTLGEAVRNFFKRIMDFFKSFVVKPSLKESLFKAIDSGRFKENTLSPRVNSYAPQYRAIEGLTEEQTNDFIQDVVSQVKLIIFREGKKELLFNPEKLTGKEVFSKVKELYTLTGAIDALGEERYEQLIKKSVEFLRTVGVTFDADDVVSINNEEANNREYASDPFSTDWKQHSTGAIKFLLSTLIEREALNQTKIAKGKELKPAKEKRSVSINGLKLLNFNRVFATLFDRLHNTNSVEEFTEKFVQLAKEDSNYLPLFKALGGNFITHTFDFDNFGESDWRLFIQFFNTFTRQKPEALIQYTNKEGEVYTSNANIFSTINQTVDFWVDNMKAIGKSKEGIITYYKDKKVYVINKEAISKLPIKKPADMIEFLNKLGIEFNQATYNGLSDKETIIKGKKTTEVKEFTNAVNSIYTQLGSNNELMTFDSKRLAINGPLRTLATLYTKVNNPSQESTYFGVEGQRIGSFSENNAPSYFENTFNESKTLEELLEKRPELHDVYSKGSVILKKGGLFFDEEGNRIAQIKVEYIQGSKNEITEKDKATAKLTEGERFMQEINQNVNGKYYVLIPGDSSTEWMMNLGNVISMDDVVSGNYWNKVYSIYSNYLNDDINLALANRTQNIYQKANSQKLRIMRDILPQGIVEDIEEMIENNETYSAIQKYISENREEINDSVKFFLEDMSKQTFKILQDSNQILNFGEDAYTFKYNLDSEFSKKYKLEGELSYEEVINVLNFVNINYAINNQEYHKILFGDPYQFKTDKGKLDETKRIKSFLSPRRRTFDTPEYNNFLNNKYNSVSGITLEEGTPGYHNHKSYTNTVTFNDVTVVGSIAMLPNIPKEIKKAFAKTNETDAVSWIIDNTHKEVAVKEGQWSEQAEAFHQWHMAYTRKAFDKKGIKKYTNEALREHDNTILSSPMPKHKLAVRKPIISGNKANKTEIDLVLDKTSQTPLYYHMVEGTNLENMYIQMFNQNIGYSIVISGRKVGAENVHSIYNEDGSFNTSPYENIIEVPWSIYGTQVETMSEGEKTQTRGSQLTKISSTDLYNNGTPVSEEAAKAYERNKKALDMLNENAYNELLNKLGVVDLGDGYALEDKQRISETLMYEMMRRELSENAKDTIQLDENGEFIMPFEASPSYVQIKNILYSMVNKALISPAMNGAPHVQVPVTMFEKATEGRSLAIKTEQGWNKISKEEYNSLSEENKEKVVLTDDTLKFYTPEAPYCEVLLPNWFKSKLSVGKFKNYTDEQLIDYLNKTPEGKKILSGIGFRIPTQALSSAEVFRVKGFLPQYMGYTVVVPSEITTKAGSDFDIDKLNMYLKSVYVDEEGKLRLVSYLGTEEETKNYFSELWSYTRAQEIQKIRDKREFKNTLLDLFNTLEEVSIPLTKELQDFYDVHINIINDIIEQADKENLLPSEYILNQITNSVEKETDLTTILLNNVGKEKFVNDMYKRALENEYYDSLEELLTLPENFNKLISPVDDAGLEDISEILDEARNYSETGIKGRLVNRNYMTKLRHAFITGKRWVGIAAVNITNLSLRQKSKVYLDPNKLSLLPSNERKFVKDLSIILPHNTVDVDGNTYVSLSGTQTADGTQFISQRLSGYATAFVDIANKPFITKIIKSDVIVSTFMFLESIGAGNTGIYFLNQPIIEKYLEYLDSINSKSVTSQSNINIIKQKFPATTHSIANASIDVSKLLDNIRYYNENNVLYHYEKEEENKLNEQFCAEQHLILNEFIKYKILADQLFSYTQATNYDTTRFGSSDALLKKEWATFNAINFNLISNVNDVLDKTFIGKQADLLSKAFGSFGAIMKTELPEIKAYTLSTLKRYATRKYMSMDDYEKIANLIKNSFLDYVIQNNTSISNMIKPLLVDAETSIVTQLEQAKQKYPSMQILQDLIPVISTRDGGANSIKLKVNSKDAYSENLYVGMMREMRDTPELNDLYNNIVNVAILQGTTQSAISIRNIIPVEDYGARISPIIQQLRPSSELEAFTNAMFERNNFKNPLLFKEFIPYVHTPKPLESTGDYHPSSIRVNPNTGEEELVYSIFAFQAIKGVTKTSRKLIALNDVYNSFQLGYDFIKIPKVVENRDGIKVNVATGLEVTKKDYALMKQKGAQDLYDYLYYKKVYTNQVDEFGNLIPLTTIGTTKEGEPLTNYYYKLINVYGDGNRAVEINTQFTPSVLNNGALKTKEELTDVEIVNALAPQVQENLVSLPTKVITQSKQLIEKSKTVEVVDRYSIMEVQSNPNKIYVFGDNIIEKGKKGQAIIRDEENAFGIPTKVLPDTTPNSYFNDNKYEANTSQINRAIEKIKNDGRTVVFPKDGLGTGLAKLKEKAPKTYAYLKQRLLEEFGFDNDNGVVQPKQVSQFEEKQLFLSTEENKNIENLTQEDLDNLDNPCK